MLMGRFGSGSSDEEQAHRWHVRAGVPVGLYPRRMAFPAHAGLAEFIDEERTTIITEWEAFARTLAPAAGGMTAMGLRDHADEILTAVIADMKVLQTAEEQARKSKGRGKAKRMDSIGKIHGALRLDSGFKLTQLVAEYRALRASVLRLWEKGGSDPRGVTRFNEAIDEALAASVKAFSETTEHFRDQSLGILGHDLRNPLSAIVLGLTAIMHSETLESEDSRIAAGVLESANRMNRMIIDLLDLTRTRLGDRIPVVPRMMDLEPLCSRVIDELEGGETAGRLRFNRTGDLRGEWDSDRIAQVLSNLVHNAIQHGAKDELITLHAMDAGDEVVLRVHNSGRAIPKDALPTIFEPMVRSGRTDQTDTGLGLGLYIASQVVLAHGGRLDASSSDGGGTTFTVRLPRHALNQKTTPPSDGVR